MPASAASRLQRLKPALERPFASRSQVILVLGACLLIWFVRRPQQVWHPYVWAEESFVVRHFLDGGWLEALRPVQGYVILPTTLLLPLAATFSFTHLPVLMATFAAVVFALTVVLLLVPGSRWGDRSTRALMALAMALCPVNPEVYGVLLYSFWWAALWPVIILGWKRDLWWARAPLLVVAAFSSPAGAAMLVPFGVSWWFRRRRADLLSAAILAAGAVVQLVSVLTSDRRESVPTSAGRVLEQVTRTLGLFPAPWIEPTGPGADVWIVVGLVVVGASVAAVVESLRRFGSVEPLLLLLPVLIFTVLSSMPFPLATSPGGDGPRYYFLPFVTLAWLLVFLLRDRRLARSTHLVAGVLLAAASIGVVANFSRPAHSTTGRLDWRVQLQRCADSDTAHVAVPIYTDGSPRHLWTLRMTPAECRDRL